MVAMQNSASNLLHDLKEMVLVLHFNVFCIFKNVNSALIQRKFEHDARIHSIKHYLILTLLDGLWGA